MRLATLGLALAIGLVAGATFAEDVLLPTFALHYPGRDRGLWNSEVYVTNPGPEPVSVWVGPVFYGAVRMIHPCLPPQVPWEIPPTSTYVRFNAAIAVDLGCPAYALGGLILRSEGDLVVGSRLVRAPMVTPERVPLAGVSQEIPGIPMSELPSSGATYMLPAVGWPASPCGTPRYESYLRVVNPGDQPITLTLQLDAAGSEGAINVDGRDVATPYPVTFGAATWSQLKVGPPAPPPDEGCQPATLRDLFFTVSDPAAVHVSVFDRTSQEPRTILPIELTPQS